jgi:hypothetical protein
MQPMALDLTYAKLLNEIEAARKDRESFLRPIRDVRKLYVGNQYRDGEGPGKAIPENMVTSWVASIIGQVAFSNPTVRIKSRVGRRRLQQAKQVQAAMNAWITWCDRVEESLLNCVDMLFGYAVALVAMQDAPRGGAVVDLAAKLPQRQLPVAVRLAPEAFFWDAGATAWSGVRLMGHEYQLDLDDAMAMPFFDPAALKEAGSDDNKAPDSGFAQKTPGETRNRITLFDVYIPEQRAIATLSPHCAKYIRPPQAFEGCRKGPYVFGGVYPVPGQPVPLSPMQAAYEQFEALAKHERIAAKNAASAKDIIINGSTDPKVGATIAKADTAGVYNIPGFRPDMLGKYSFGGANPDAMRYIQELRSRADNQSGMSNIRRGSSDGGNATATEIATLQNNADVRVGFITNRFVKFERDVLRRVAYNLYHQDTVAMTIEMPDEPGEAGIYLGGPGPGQEDDDFEEDYDLDIEPFSMRRVDPIVEGQQARETFQLITQAIAPAMQAFPWLKWRDILDDLGESMNVPDFADRIIPDQQQQPEQPAGMMPQQAMNAPPGDVMASGRIPAESVSGRTMPPGMALAMQRAQAQRQPRR